MIRKIVNSIFQFPVRIYQWTLSPLLRTVFGMRCRYEPSCSHYMIGSIEEWGVLRGTLLGLKRIGRCHPWGGFGEDPIPPNPNRK